MSADIVFTPDGGSPFSFSSNSLSIPFVTDNISYTLYKNNVESTDTGIDRTSRTISLKGKYFGTDLSDIVTKMNLLKTNFYGKVGTLVIPYESVSHAYCKSVSFPETTKAVKLDYEIEFEVINLDEPPVFSDLVLGLAHATNEITLDRRANVTISKSPMEPMQVDISWMYDREVRGVGVRPRTTFTEVKAYVGKLFGLFGEVDTDGSFKNAVDCKIPYTGGDTTGIYKAESVTAEMDEKFASADIKVSLSRIDNNYGSLGAANSMIGIAVVGDTTVTRLDFGAKALSTAPKMMNFYAKNKGFSSELYTDYSLGKSIQVSISGPVVGRTSLYSSNTYTRFATLESIVDSGFIDVYVDAEKVFDTCAVLNSSISYSAESNVGSMSMSLLTDNDTTPTGRRWFI